MPTTSALTLGIVGAGATSSKNAAALLSDLIEAQGGKARIVLPATKDHWSEIVELIADFALENKVPLTLVTNDTTASHKALKAYVQQATTTVKAVNVVSKVVALTAEKDGKLLMLWDDEDDDCYNALEAAEKAGIEVLDLTAGLHKIEFTGDSTDPEAGPEEDAEDPEQEEAEPEADDLDEMTDEQIEELAVEMQIDPEPYDSWDDVRQAIREAREEDEGQDAESQALPTADEVMDWPFSDLKDFAQNNGIDVPPRTKTSGYRKAVSDWLNNQDGVEPTEEDDEGELELPTDDDDEAVGQVIVDLTAVTEEVATLRSYIQNLTSQVETLGASLTENLIEIRTAIMEITPAGTIQKAQAAASKAVKAAAPAKAAPAPAKRSVTRPAAAPAKAPAKAPARRSVSRANPAAEETPKAPERPLDPFMHLIGKKLTKAQAKEILIAAQSRGRGRPTEDERTLINQAKEIVPQV